MNVLALLKKYRDWILCVGILGVIGGAGSIFLLPGMRWRAAAFEKPPQQLTLSELAKHGPGDNPHVVVSDFVCGSAFVFKIETRQGGNQPAQERSGSGQAWIPLFSKSEFLLELPLPNAPEDLAQPVGDPKSFVVLLQTVPAQGSATDFHLLIRRQQMTGLIIPYWLSKLTPELRGKLQTAYPDTRFDQCLILEETNQHNKADTILFAQALLLGAIVGPLFGLPALALAIKLGGKPKPPPPAEGTSTIPQQVP
jgi:hypothetical protein